MEDEALKKILNDLGGLREKQNNLNQGIKNLERLVEKERQNKQNSGIIANTKHVSSKQSSIPENEPDSPEAN
ncbi:hypothetical protein SD71_04815 [Cohnella kolymensis]|uniref:Transposase n=1 Tax=Cohnella kolymensis TaxID=1590652 RepID=A0ABR5A7L2_9BACL|nr:hypothetical protein [Cohnella kolymensis]KIL37009.1 hypothetical protein SD71_04815 [Cohnella kolymensis]